MRAIAGGIIGACLGALLGVYVAARLERGFPGLGPLPWGVWAAVGAVAVGIAGAVAMSRTERR